MKDGLLKEITAHGNRGAIVPFSYFDELKRELEDLRTDKYHGFSDWLAGTMVIPDDLGFQPRSIILVITPSPKVTVGFTYHGKVVNCNVPPQYLDEGFKNKEVSQYINDYLKPLGYRAASFDRLPLKLLAVHAGLGLYGRNNICFDKEFGSYILLLSYVSDLPCDEADWFPVRRMDTCDKCRACINACPTKAIEPDHRIVNTSVCLTKLNEYTDEFPEWLPRTAHNSLIGCIKCQDCCPCNAHIRDNVVKGVTFTEDETIELLTHKDDEPYSDLLAAKLDESGFNPWILKVLPRNLAVLLQDMT